jgi:hypothetical protein
VDHFALKTTCGKSITAGPGRSNVNTPTPNGEVSGCFVPCREFSPADSHFYLPIGFLSHRGGYFA